MLKLSGLGFRVWGLETIGSSTWFHRLGRYGLKVVGLGSRRYTKVDEEALLRLCHWEGVQVI